ncbi:MAG: hypothetical protein LBI90_02620 [Treponema sp.]|jgi:hypothetical protein|nr:hypothetical protein [Treponema sp.]
MVILKTESNIKRSLVLTVMILFLCVSCYDPIFYTISQESKPTESKIKGTPSSMVLFRNGVYAASSDLYRYEKQSSGNAGWRDIPGPGGKIVSLAATGKALYALSFLDSSLAGLTLFKSVSGEGDWVRVLPYAGNKELFDNYRFIDSLYADEESVFVGIKNEDRNDDDDDDTAYAVAFEASDGFLHILMENTKPLTGAVSRKDKDLGGNDVTRHFLATAGDGLHIFHEMDALIGPIDTGKVPDLGPGEYGDIGPGDPSEWNSNDEPTGSILVDGKIWVPEKNADYSAIRFNYFSSLSKLDDTVLAVALDGRLFAIPSNNPKLNIYYWGRWEGSLLGGEMGIWNPNPNIAWHSVAANQGKRLLLLGLYSGYMELVIDPDGTLQTNANGGLIFFSPGTSGLHFSSIEISDDAYQQYINSLGKHSVHSFFQVPEYIDPASTLFAITQDDGVWSYRWRDTSDGWRWTWNHE